MVQKFFLKRLRKFIITMMIPTLIIFSISFYMFLQTTEKEIQEDGQQTVQSVKTNFDVVISNVLYQNDLLSNTTKMSIALKKILSESGMSYRDAMHINILRLVVDSIITSHKYIDSIYFYLDGYHRFFSSKDGVKNIETSTDTNWIEDYDRMDCDTDSLVMARKLQGSVETVETISIFRRLLLQDGCIVVNINMNKFRNMLRSMCTNEYETIYLLDSNGNILLDASSGNEDMALVTNYLEQLPDDNEDIGNTLQSMTEQWLKIDNKKYNFAMAQYEPKKIYIISVISSNARNALIANMLQTYLLILLVNCVIVSLLSYWITYRTFEQIKYMINVFDDAEKGIFNHKIPNRIQDEYDIIMNNVIHMFINTTYLNTQLKEKQYRQEATELKALQLQINPHFLFNTLQTLDMEVRKNKSDDREISRIIQNVSDILKYSLSDAQETVTIQKEMIYLKKYIEIQKFRFGSNFIIYYEIGDEVQNAKVFKLLLQPIVENSLMHGIRNINHRGYIKIKIFKKKDTLKCIVTDNGVGMDDIMIKQLYQHINDESSKSIGLTNVNRRLKLRYGSGSAITIRAKKNWGMSISFKIPYIKQE